MKITVNDLKPEERTRCEVWTRVMGYLRPKEYANTGKQGEFAERKFFQMPDQFDRNQEKYPDTLPPVSVDDQPNEPTFAFTAMELPSVGKDAS